MGCFHSCLSPDADDLYGHKGKGAAYKPKAQGHAKAGSKPSAKPDPYTKPPSPRIPAAMSLLLQPEELLHLADTVAAEYLPGEADGLQLAAIALIESGGRIGGSFYIPREDDLRIGLCRMRLSVAKVLAHQDGCDVLGPPTPLLLHEPIVSLYYCGAYLRQLRQLRYQSSRRQRDQFSVKAYCAGPGAVDSEDAALYWERYCNARDKLRVLVEAILQEQEASNSATDATPRSRASHSHASATPTADSPTTTTQQPSIAIKRKPAHHPPPQQPQRPPRIQLHTLMPNETPTTVAKHYKLDLEDLVTANPELARDPFKAQPGWVLLIPTPGSTIPSLAPPRQPASSMSSLASQRSAHSRPGRPAPASPTARTRSAPQPRSSSARVESWLSAAEEPEWLRQHLMADAAAARKDQQAGMRTQWSSVGSVAEAGPTTVKQAVSRSGPRRSPRSGTSMALPKVMME